MTIQRKRVAKRLASGLLAGAMALGGLAISGSSVSAKTPSTPTPNARLYGADRYETAVAVARDHIASGGAPNGGLVIASGEAPYDALAGSVLTSATRPMVLVKKDSIPQDVLDLLADYKASWFTASPTFYILGGESAVSKSVFDAIKAAVTTTGDTTPPTVTRVSGSDRYATAAEISKVGGVTQPTDTLVIASGVTGKWADALSAANYSAENGFPIVLTGPSGFDATSKATVDAYLASSGSVKKFLIVGGPLSVPSSVEDYLITTKLVAPANVFRVQGADRYQTNFLMNNYILSPYGGTFNGERIALVSGDAPYDALVAAGWAAQRNVHVVLTPAAGGNTWVSTLSAVLSGLNGTNPGFGVLGTNATVYAIGGRTAVADTATAAYVAASSGAANLTSTLTCPTAGGKYVYLDLSGRLPSTGTQKTDFTTAATMDELFKLKSAVQTAAGGFTIADDGAVTVGSNSRQYYEIVLDTATAAGDVVTFAGITENVPFGGVTWPRSVAGSSCTVSADSLGPIVTAKAVVGSVKSEDVTTSAGAHVYVSANEPIKFTTTSGAASNLLTIAGASVTSGAVFFTAVGSAGDNGTNTKWLLSLPSSSALAPSQHSSETIAANTTLSISKSLIQDQRANNPVADVSTIFQSDAVPASLSVAAVSISATKAVSLTAGSLKFTATATGTQYGAIGSDWSLSVVNSRGLQSPTVKIDNTAKTITVTADTGYHTVNDVANAHAMTWDADWGVTSTGLGTALVSITLAPSTCVATASCGQSNVDLAVVSAEPFMLDGAIDSATVGGTGVTVTIYNEANITDGGSLFLRSATGVGTSNILSFATTKLGAVQVNFKTSGANTGVFDMRYNRTIAPLTTTIS